MEGTLYKKLNGHSVNVREDNWLPQQNGYKVLSQNSSSINIVQVKDLMVEQQGGWNHKLLDNHF